MQLVVNHTLPNSFSVVTDASGKLLSRTKTKSGFRTVYEVEHSTVEIRIKSFFELETRLWLLKWIMFWCLGIFGMFNSRYENLFPQIDKKITIKLAGEGAVVDLNFGKSIKIARSADIGVTVKNCEIVFDTNADGFEPSKHRSNYFTCACLLNDKICARTRLMYKLSWVLRIVGIVVTIAILINVL
jgi:hypothetical protein